MKRIKKKAIKIFWLLIPLFFIFIFYFFLKSPLFLIKEIVVTTDFNISENLEINRILNDLRKQNFFSINEKKITQELKNLDLKIAEIFLKKEFPNKVLIDIKKRKAIAVIPQEDSFLLIDDEGLIFSQEKNVTDLPIIILRLQNFKVGSRIEEEGKIILTVLKSLTTYELVEKVEVLENEVLRDKEANFMLSNGIIIVFPLEKIKLRSKLETLQILINRFRIEGRMPRKIDLRFEKPVLSF